MAFEQIPLELKQRNQWVLWRLEQRNGEETKVPYSINGNKASSTDSETWTSFSSVTNTLNRSNGKYTGIGYVFSTSDPYIGIDLDKFENVRQLPTRWVEWVKRMNTYTEWSQSKKGLHMIVKAKKVGKGSRKDAKRVEVYDRGRFFVMTGDVVDSTPPTIEDRQTEFDAFYQFVFGESTRESIADFRQATSQAPLTDDEILEKARNAKNSSKFMNLYYVGDISGYESHSNADQALCNLLAFYTRDAEQVARMFKASALDPHARGKHPKPEQNDAYALRTAKAAIDGTTEWFGDREMHKKKPSDEGQMADTQPIHNVTQSIPRLNEDAYYGLAGDYIRLVEPYSEADPAGMLIHFLTGAGNLMGMHVKLKVGKNGWLHPRIFSVIVGKTGKGRKGTAYSDSKEQFQYAFPVWLKERVRPKGGLASGEGLLEALKDGRTKTVEISGERLEEYKRHKKSRWIG